VGNLLVLFKEKEINDVRAKTISETFKIW